MDTLNVELAPFPRHTRGQAWLDACRYMSHHDPHMPSRPVKRCRYPNKNWMMRRQWYLSQSLLLLRCSLQSSSEKTGLDCHLQNLINTFKEHAALSVHTTPLPVIDDTDEEEFYLDVLARVERATVVGELEADSRDSPWLRTTRVDRLERELAEARGRTPLAVPAAWS